MCAIPACIPICLPGELAAQDLGNFDCFRIISDIHVFPWGKYGKWHFFFFGRHLVFVPRALPMNFANFRDISGINSKTRRIITKRHFPRWLRALVNSTDFTYGTEEVRKLQSTHGWSSLLTDTR